MLLENESFLTELNNLFVNKRSNGTVTLTVKKYDGRTKPLPKDRSKQKPNSESLCLIRARATNEKRKISTVVHQKDVVKFQIAYFSLLKNSCDGLKKAKKVKKSKAV